MKLITTVAALSILAVGVPRAADQQAFLGIFVETTNMRMAGMKMPKIPKFELPPGIKLPPGVKLPSPALLGGPSRKLTVRLWSAGIAPDDATASLAIPEGLKQGSKLDLSLYRPKPESGDGGGDVTGGPGGGSTDMVIKQYWGSSETVRPGQPEVIEFKGLNAEQKSAMHEQMMKARQTNSYFYKPDWTTGYWPTDKQPGTIDPDAVLTGHYALTTSYTGNVALDVPENVGFLDPIEMTSPELESVVPMDQFIHFHWKNIPHALGFYATVFGMQGKNTIIMWSSSEIKPRMGFVTDYLQMSEVADFVKDQTFMAGDRVDVTVPKAIFQDCDIVTMQMIGYGPGTALEKGQPLPRVQSKTTLMINLGGKKMQHGRPGAGDNE